MQTTTTSRRRANIDPFGYQRDSAHQVGSGIGSEPAQRTSTAEPGPAQSATSNSGGRRSAEKLDQDLWRAGAVVPPAAAAALRYRGPERALLIGNQFAAAARVANRQERDARRSSGLDISMNQMGCTCRCCCCLLGRRLSNGDRPVGARHCRRGALCGFLLLGAHSSGLDDNSNSDPSSRSAETTDVSPSSASVSSQRATSAPSGARADPLRAARPKRIASRAGARARTRTQRRQRRRRRRQQTAPATSVDCDSAAAHHRNKLLSLLLPSLSSSPVQLQLHFRRITNSNALDCADSPPRRRAASGEQLSASASGEFGSSVCCAGRRPSPNPRAASECFGARSASILIIAATDRCSRVVNPSNSGKSSITLLSVARRDYDTALAAAAAVAAAAIATTTHETLSAATVASGAVSGLGGSVSSVSLCASSSTCLSMAAAAATKRVETRAKRQREHQIGTDADCVRESSNEWPQKHQMISSEREQSIATRPALPPTDKSCRCCLGERPTGECQVTIAAKATATEANELSSNFTTSSTDCADYSQTNDNISNNNNDNNNTGAGRPDTCCCSLIAANGNSDRTVIVSSNSNINKRLELCNGRREHKSCDRISQSSVALDSTENNERASDSSRNGNCNTNLHLTSYGDNDSCASSSSSSTTTTTTTAATLCQREITAQPTGVKDKASSELGQPDSERSIISTEPIRRHSDDDNDNDNDSEHNGNDTSSDLKIAIGSFRNAAATSSRAIDAKSDCANGTNGHRLLCRRSSSGSSQRRSANSTDQLADDSSAGNTEHIVIMGSSLDQSAIACAEGDSPAARKTIVGCVAATPTAAATAAAAASDTQIHPKKNATPTAPPIALPNNTLIEDLSKCHRNVTDLWPRASQATVAAVSAFRACLKPPTLRKQQHPPPTTKQQQRTTPIDVVDHAHDHYSHHRPDPIIGAHQRLASAASNSDESLSSGARKIRASNSRTKSLKFEMPDSLNRLNTTLKEEDYDKALNTLTNDIRYQLHLLLYTRLDTIWTLLSTVLCILVPVLLANLELPILIGTGCLWLVSMALGAFVTRRTRKNLDLMLERSVAQANSFFMDHNLMLGVMNVGGLLSRTKLIVPMLYFDTSQCREQIESIISADAQKLTAGSDSNEPNNSKRVLDYSKIGLPSTEPNMMALAQSQLAKKIVLRHIQRWISYFEKRKLMFTDDRIEPRHLSTGKCLCQFIEEHFKNTDLRDYQDDDYSSDNCDGVQTTRAANLNKTTQVNGTKLSIDSTMHYKTAGNALSPDKLHSNGLLAQMSFKQEATISYLKNNPYYNANNSVPTLSGLVSIKSDQHLNHYVGNLSRQQQVVITGDLKSSSSYVVLSNDEHLDDNGNITTKRNSLNLNNNDISLEMDNDVIGRSDDLVRKLRLLLELRKDDLRGLDGPSLFANALDKVPQQQYLFYPPEDGCSSMGHNTLGPHTSIDIPDDTGIETTANMKTKNLKKFFSQGESSFFFGLKKNQKDTNMSQVLEIC